MVRGPCDDRPVRRTARRSPAPGGAFALSAALLALVGCAPRAHLGPPPAASAAAPASGSDDAPSASAAELPGEPSLVELYPSLGEEEDAPPSPELELEIQEEEAFLSEAVPASVRLDLAALRAKYDIPIEVTPTVEQFLVYFQTRGRKWYEKWMARSTRYLPMMRQVFRENGLPEDLVYLAMIESGFSMKAWSRAKASGPWQFMKATGSRYGLHDDWWIDERRDPEQATRAAAAHLKDLYDEFGDWYLAAAAYNAGAGKINKAIAKYGTRNYWELCKAGRYLKPETKHYVPKLIAAAILAKHPEQFGFNGIDYLEPLEYEEVTVPDATDLRVVSECAGADYDSVLELNPSLKRFCTPPGRASFAVRVPKGTSAAFADAYARLPPEKRLTFRRHVVRSGETLSAIARRYGTSSDAVLRMNGMVNARRLRAGRELVIPIPEGHIALLAAAAPEPEPESKRPAPPARRVTAAGRVASDAASLPGAASIAGRELVRLTLAPGDTLWAISNRYGVTVDDVKRWNGIRNHRSVQAGATLNVYVPRKEPVPAAGPKPIAAGDGTGVLSYRVKKGDTVWDIAREHNVDPLALLKSNNLSRRSKIRPGDVLVIRVADSTPAH